MAPRPRNLDADDLWSLTQDLDVPGVLRTALRTPAASSAAPTDGAYDPVSGVRCELPAGLLGTLRSAGLVALGADHLLPPGVVTAGMVGTAPAVWWHLAVLCRALPRISHVTVCAGGEPVPPRVVDELDLVGIGLSTAADAAGAAFGATLVVGLDPAPPLAADHLAPGAVLVEAGPGAFPAPARGLVDEVRTAGQVLAAVAAGLPGPVRPDCRVLVEWAGVPGGLDAALAAAVAAAAARTTLGLAVR